MQQNQQESISDLKMMTLLLKKSKKSLKTPKAKASSSKSKGKEKEGEYYTSEHSDGYEDNFRYENLESSSEEPENSEAEDSHAKRMNELEKCLEAIANQSDLQEVGGGQAISDGVGCFSLPSQVQGTNSANLWW